MVQFGQVKLKHRWKLHPQPSSVRKVREVINRYDFSDTVVLDCFCGTGTIPYLVSDVCKIAIGTDIEDYSWYLRRLNSNKNVKFVWNIDCYDSVKNISHDILFIDPPNPNCIVGGRPISAYRDTGIKGSELNRYWKSVLSSRNLINKKDKTVKCVYDIIKYEINRGIPVIINLFGPYAKFISVFENIKQLYDTYYLIEL